MCRFRSIKTAFQNAWQGYYGINSSQVMSRHSFLLLLKISSAFSGLLLLTACWVPSESNARRNRDLKPIIVAVGEWQPYVTKDRDAYGELTEIVSLTLNRMGYTPDLKFMPWGQAEKLVRENEYENGVRMTFPFQRTPKREREFILSDKPILKECLNFFYNKDKISSEHPIAISSLQNLDKYNIAYIDEEEGYQYPRELDDVLLKSGIKVNSLYEAFSKLLDKDDKVNLVPELPEVGYEVLYNMFPEKRFSVRSLQTRQLGDDSHRCLAPAQYFVLVSQRNNNNLEFIKEFNKVYKELPLDALQRIKIKYKEKPSPRHPKVSLRSCGHASEIALDSAPKTDYLVPNGSSGVLLNWDLDYPSSEILKQNATSIYSKVKVTNGPYRGKTFALKKQCIYID